MRAEPLDGGDVKLLAGIICPGMTIGTDVLERLRKVSNGSARRVVTRLYDLSEQAGINGWETITLDTWNPSEGA